jgi:hypothetical protein
VTRPALECAGPANPDLRKRIELDLPLNPYDRSTFYGFDGRGYINYPLTRRPCRIRFSFPE